MAHSQSADRPDSHRAPQRDFDGRVAVITGASRGIGRALALNLAAGGATVVVNYRSNEGLADAVVENLKQLGGDGVAVRADVEDPDDILHLFDVVAKKYGRLDFFVNNAAASVFKKVLDLKVKHLHRSYAINLRAFVLGAQEAVKLMDNGGRIVAVTSYGSSRAFASYAALGSYKAAVESYIRYMAVEFADYKITVNGVNGGLIESDSLNYFYAMPGMARIETVLEAVPLKRAGTADEMARTIEFLLSASAGYITGQVLVVDGGLTVAAPPFYRDTVEPASLPARPTRARPDSHGAANPLSKN